jgi:integrase
VDQAPEREAAGSRWQDTERVFTTATGTPLGARHIWKLFQDVCERAGFGRDRAPRDLRHTFVSLLSDDGMASRRSHGLLAMPVAMSPRLCTDRRKALNLARDPRISVTVFDARHARSKAHPAELTPSRVIPQIKDGTEL